MIMALAPVVGSQLQDRRFGYLMDSSGVMASQALDSASSTLGRLQQGTAADGFKIDGGRRGMAKKGKLSHIIPHSLCL